MPKRYKVLITGSSGMFGVDLCLELGGEYELIGTDIVHRSSFIVHRFYKVNITDKDAISDVIGKTKPDIVIHAAAWTDVDGCELDPKKAYAVNAGGTKNVALACKKANAALIYISTDFVFDGKKKTPYREGDKTGPISVYGDSKLKGEEAVKKTLNSYFILRTSWLYGKNGKNFVDTIITKAKAAKTLKIVDDQIGSPTYTRDLAKAIHALLDRNQSTEYRNQTHGIYHVSNSGSVSWYEYAKEILKLSGSKTKVLAISSEELARPAKRPAMSVLDNTKFFEFTGHKMRPWQDALKEYLKLSKSTHYTAKTQNGRKSAK